MSVSNETLVSKTLESKTPMTKAPKKTPVFSSGIAGKPAREMATVIQDAKVALAKRIEFERGKDHELVKGMFKNYETQGATKEFSFKKYKGDKTIKYTLTDNEYYELPRMVARWLNKGGVVQEYTYKTDHNGRPVMAIGTKRHRVGFQSLDFTTDLDDAREYDSIVTANPIANDIL